MCVRDLVASILPSMYTLTYLYMIACRNYSSPHRKRGNRSYRRPLLSTSSRFFHSLPLSHPLTLSPFHRKRGVCVSPYVRSVLSHQPSKNVRTGTSTEEPSFVVGVLLVQGPVVVAVVPVLVGAVHVTLGTRRTRTVVFPAPHVLLHDVPVGRLTHGTGVLR